jgi:3',5'-cyclic-AMP phosphodiesterase
MSRVRPAAIVQISDLHLGADWTNRDPSRELARCVAAITRLDLTIAAVLVLGDIAEHATDAEYLEACAQLRRVEAPVHVAMGNRDDRERLRHHFGLTAAGDAPLNYAVTAGPFRLLVVDTTVPGSDSGRLEPSSLRWLDEQLSADRSTPSLLALHHPPLLTGSPAWDQIALDSASRRELAAVLAGARQVHAILGAHLHRPVATDFAGRPLLVSPSTYAQFPLSLTAHGLEPDDEPPGYVVHLITDGPGLLSSFQTVI